MNCRHPLAILSVALLAACGQVAHEQPEPSESTTGGTTQALTGFTGQMNASHQYIGFVLLADGRALAADIHGAEVYNRATNQWTAVAPMITEYTFFHALIRLPDGRVLAAGGEGGSPYYSASASIYDPTTNTWSLTGSLASSRSRPLATLLADGRVLLVGGVGGSTGSIQRTAEIHEPSTGTWTTVAASATYAYSNGTATLLPDNRVLLVGSSGAEVFDPSTGTFTVVGDWTYGRIDHVAELLPTGKVLLTAGHSPKSYLFDPATLQFSETGALAAPIRWNAASTRLNDGSVLVAGGHDGAGSTLDSVERYNPTTGTWTSAPPLAQKREYAKMVQLSTGEVLVAGGLYRLTSNVVTMPSVERAAELILGTCIPTTCAAEGWNCGSIPNGCGGALDCGSCGTGYTCGAGACVQVPANQALYDTALRAPACSQETSSCDSGSLLVGRARLGPEPQAPNTIGNSCADGMGGSFHLDESLDGLRVTTLDGAPLTGGKTVRVEATVWAYTDYSSDYLDLYYAANASSPSWVHIGTLSPTGSRAQVLSTTYVLPLGSRQAIRGVFRYGGIASPCGSGGYDDRDDLVFPVVAPEDSQSPTVSLTAPAPATIVSGDVTIQANATDDVGVTRVDFYVQTNTSATPTLIGSDTTAPYSVTWNTLQTAPASSYVRAALTARAYDAVGHETVSSSHVVVVDNTPPTVALTAPAGGSTVSNSVAIRVNATDDSGIDRVSFYVDGQIVGTLPGTSYYEYAMSWNTATVSPGTHTVRATAWDKLGNPATTATISVTVASPGVVQAAYSTTWRAPTCAVAGTSCDSGSLLVGRANVGPEANAPNTLGGTCADGPSGWFQFDKSLDRLKIVTADGGNLRGGALVQVSATFWASSTSDMLDIYYAASAASPVWILAGTLNATASGQQTRAEIYTLPTGSTTQVVRGVFRNGGTRTTCASGAYDDNDDLVFAVQ